MKQVVLKYGLIGAGVFGVLMSIQMTLVETIGWGHSEVVGYTTMVLAFLMVFFGVRSYRDTVARGQVSFGRAFQVGILIALIATAGYVVAWEIIFYNFMPDFAEKYGKSVVDNLHAAGATADVIAAKTAEMQKFAESYKNPLVNISYTFIEAFPVGLIFALVSAGILRRKSSPELARGVA